MIEVVAALIWDKDKFLICQKKLEHNDIKWITPVEIPNYDFCPADEEILERLIKT